MAYNLLSKRSTYYCRSGSSTPAMGDLYNAVDIRAWGSAYYEQTDNDKLNNQSKVKLVAGIYLPTSAWVRFQLNAKIYKKVDGNWTLIGSGNHNHSTGTTISSGDTTYITITDKIVEHDSIGDAQFRVNVAISDVWIEVNTAYVQCSNQSYSYTYDLPTIENQASITNVSFYEANNTLIGYGVTDNTYVNNLSNKVYTINIDNPNSFVVDYYKMENPNVIYNTSNNNVVNLDFLGRNIVTELVGEQKKPIIYAYVNFTNGYQVRQKIDSSNVTFIDYQLPQFIPTSTTAKRNGQLSGKVFLNVQGTYFNGEIGSLNQGGTYKPTIEYKYWKSGDTEPSTYDNTISASNITISNGTFSVTNLEIGSDNTSATNYFNPNYQYLVRLKVNDTFDEPTTTSVTITRGIAIWTEYADRVDFKKATINGGTTTMDSTGINTNKLLAGNIDYGSGIATKDGNVVTFNKTFTSIPYIIVTPVTTISGVIAIKISNVTTTGFTATTGGTTDFGDVDINWLAIGNN